MLLFPLFATGVIDTGGNLLPVTIFYRYQQLQQYWRKNLPPVSLIPLANFPPVKLTPAANLSLVSLIPVVHLHLRIFFPKCLENFVMTLMLFSRVWEKMRKKHEA
jgi:hypothetical protein